MPVGKGKSSWGVDIDAKAGEQAKADVCRAVADTWEFERLVGRDV